MKNILITGGAGFIGSNLALSLIKKGYTVTVLDNLSPQIHGDDPKHTSPLFKSIENKVRFIEGSVTERGVWLDALEGQDAVVHLAAETGTGQSMYEIEKYTSVNVGGTALMLDILANTKHSIRKIVIASSRAVYGEGKYHCSCCGDVYPTERSDEAMQHGNFECTCPLCGSSVELRPTDEESKIHPTSIYGLTKQMQAEMVLVAGKSLGIPAVAFRYQNVYGPGQSLSNPYTGILSIFSTLIKNGKDINIFEDGKESRDFVYIDDVVAATILGLERDEANYHTFNVGADKPIDVITVARTLQQKYDSNVEIKVSGNYRLGDIRHNYADLTLATKLLGYTPSVSFDQGIGRFAAWVDSQEIQADRYEQSIEEMKSKGLYK
ncbi:NAD(P)-dependent oxidoreductase [uncultured Rikenella sp.]|uniref:NAD-dependent epimerase/dehydratase family protein n=1 Tax=uncultured Rikenella sp. TaxID=368003 RepID=UPI0026130516|nr:NAD-dependent epimerase/dehydratase family protein [uncultured Rikenella sp.]